MRYVSTRDPSHAVGLGEALQRSLAPDGGLYVPRAFPSFRVEDFAASNDLAAIAGRWLEPFFEGDPLAGALPEICRSTFSFPIPLKFIDEKTAVLELFHGPTAAFKDVGARFLSECLERLPADPPTPRTILVATSGDTGGAVAAAFYRRAGFEVWILFPKGKVSARQQAQLTAWGENVRAFAVKGGFDDCQRMVKAAFADPWWRGNHHLVSANSINLGRLLPQGAYYVAASLRHARERGEAPVFIIPSGNLGNATAALWAKRTALPLARVILSMNENRAVADYLRDGVWRPRPTVATLANAMDVGDPSNMERVRHLYPHLADLRRDLSVTTVSNDEIRQAIREGRSRWGEIWCPHTATAAFTCQSMDRLPAVIVATAHPSKFDTIVEPLTGEKITVPPGLAALLSRPAHFREIAADLTALRRAVEGGQNG